MKKTSFIIFLIFYGIAVFGQNNEKRGIQKLDPFDKIIISKGINVTLREGEQPQAEIVISNAELDDVIIQQKGKEITIKMKTKVYKDIIVNVYVTYQNLNTIIARSGGTLDADDIIETDCLTLEAGLDAAIELEVEVKKLIVSVSTARVQVKGTADYLEVKASSLGKYLGVELECKEAKVKANSGANIQVYATEKIESTSSSGAKIEYAGDPPKIFATGKISKINTDETSEQ
jgi:hypothetical protein